MSTPALAAGNHCARVLPWWAGLLPWVVYAAGRQTWPVAAAPLALAVTVLAARWAGGARNLLDVGFMGYFFILSCLAWSGWDQELSPRARFALCPAVLAVAAGWSVAVRRPFTFEYARAHAPEKLRSLPAFFRANQWISLLWMVGFAGAAAAMLGGSGAWSGLRGALILGTALGAAAVASALVGGWFHLRESRRPS